jgi:fructose-1,6-bisphosphatase I
VYGFTLDQSLGEFLLTQENLRMPPKLEFFAVNHGREKYWTPGVRAYVRWLQGLEGVEGMNGGGPREPLACRYTGSLVMDFHRTLMRGGVFLYPGDTKAYGKLRLVYECAPLAFIAEQAGGAATDGVRRLLDVVPSALHQITPIFIGNRELVEHVPYFLARHDEAWMADYRRTW